MTGREDWIPWREIHEESMRDPEYRAMWERTAFARAVAVEVIRYRTEHGLSQTALARKLRMQQPAISRLEIGETNPSWDTLVRLADVLGLEFLVDIAPAGKRAKLVSPELKRATKVERWETKGARITVATA